MKWRAMMMILLGLAVSGCVYSTRTTPSRAQSVPAEPVPTPAAMATSSPMESQIVNGYHVTTD